jgi:glycosyltransferase involved in cell wall biosynthesis
MKVVYFSQPFFADCDFPLIKEMQERGINVRYYMPIGYGFKSSSILELETPIRKWGIHKASKIKGMEKYKKCLDLDKLYFICGRSIKWWPMSWLLWICLYIHILFYRTDIFHITWQLRNFEKILFYLPFVSKKIMTVHDPLQHSGLKKTVQNETDRIKCFKWATNFILLNNQQVDDFSRKYNIPKEKIHISKLGIYDSIKYLDLEKEENNGQYVLFFGQITPHKGVEYLLDAMPTVNKEFKNVKLIIAGSGRIYFDIDKYADKDYIKIENRYIGISELAKIVCNSMFVVCPYKDATQSGVVQTAFALEVPVIATNVGALPEMVKDGMFGKIVPPGDSAALATAMIDLIKDKEELNKYKNNIKTHWISSMSWTPIVKNLLLLYEQ